LADILESDEKIDKKHFLSDSFRKKLENSLKEQGKTIILVQLFCMKTKVAILAFIRTPALYAPTDRIII